MIIFWVVPKHITNVHVLAICQIICTLVLTPVLATLGIICTWFYVLDPGLVKKHLINFA